MTDQKPPYWASELAEHEADMTMPYQPPADEETCGVSYDHTLPAGHTECRTCGADLSAWLDDEDDHDD